MPNVKINKKEFEDLLGETVDEETLENRASYLGVHWSHVEGEKWNVEVYPDRPDMLSVEGLARAYRGFFGIETGLADYDVSEGNIQLSKDDSVERVRPYIGCAVVKDLELSERMINGLIQLQEKMHESMGRRRDKLAIGLHDLSAVEPPFEYKAVEPEQVSFKPLEYDSELNLGEILDEHEKGQEYAWILEDEDRYPIIVDAKDRVLSFPPIINNQLTEVHTGTTDIFVDVTGKDRQTVMKALNILTTALAERGGDIESVEVDGEEMPDLEPGEERLDPDYFRSISGLELENEEIVEKMEQMRFGAKTKRGELRVEVPAYRTDIMHDYDLIEEGVIAHGYDEVKADMPEIDQVAEEKDIEDFTNILRDILQGAGALEAHTTVLSSEEKLFEKMDLEKEEIAEMSNALTEDYSVARNWILPSMVEVLNLNRQHRYPQSFFEVEDTVVIDDSHVGASNRRKLGYVVSGPEKDYTDARGILQVLERDLGIELEVEEDEKACFRPQRAGKIVVDGEEIGIIGELSSSVRENWDLPHAAAGFEIDVEKLEKYF